MEEPGTSSAVHLGPWHPGCGTGQRQESGPASFLHSMTCAKCNHGFCWRCLKPWKPSHKDYYNCSAMVRGWAPGRAEARGQLGGGALCAALCRGSVQSSPTVAGTAGRRQNSPRPTDAGRSALQGLCTGPEAPEWDCAHPAGYGRAEVGWAFLGQQGRAEKSKG